ncbi:MAG: hypothetical protein ACOCUS_02215 [Polyangiales bacterium]
MSSPILLCGQALALLGVQPIDSFDDGTPVADACARIYGPLRDQLLAAHPWNFAQRTFQLAKRATPPTGWRSAFALPPDLLELRGIWPTADLRGPSMRAWDWQNGDVVAELDQAWALYLARVPEEIWTAPFAALVRYALAAELAMPLTESGERAQYWEQRAYGLPSQNVRGGQFGVAVAADAQSAPSITIEHTPLADARHGLAR